MAEDSVMKLFISCDKATDVSLWKIIYGIDLYMFNLGNWQKLYIDISILLEVEK